MIDQKPSVLIKDLLNKGTGALWLSMVTRL